MLSVASAKKFVKDRRGSMSYGVSAVLRRQDQLAQGIAQGIGRAQSLGQGVAVGAESDQQGTGSLVLIEPLLPQIQIPAQTGEIPFQKGL